MTKEKTAVLKAPAPARKQIKLSPALASIDNLTEAYATAYGLLYAEMAALNAEIEAAKRARMMALRKLVADAKSAKATLSFAITAHAEEFQKPRTRQLHGFKVGLRKLEGKMVFADEAKAVQLIKKHFPDQFDVLVATSYSVVKDAAGQLPAADLKRIGGEITDSVDEVVIKSQMGDVEKIVSALIAEKAES